ncbi:putative P450 monooxygenase [Delphinella strobiligena]|nr:putative P450 monooxygenase [Delphinella strobiligena]
MRSNMSPIHVVAFGQGVLSHILFKRGEQHRFPQRFIQFYLVIYLIGVSTLVNYGRLQWSIAISLFTSWTATYFIGLFASLLIYRAFFNPLNKFPGPYSSRISKWNTVFRNARHLNSDKNLLRLHNQYGRFVRVGPNDLSITEPRAVTATQGPSSKCYKGPWYDVEHPLPSLQLQRPKSAHDRRRRVWSPAFSDKALRGYENRMQKFNHQLISQLYAQAGTPVNATLWFNLYSFDIMGDLAFAKSYKMLESGTPHSAFTILSEGMEAFGYTLPDWAVRLIISIPLLTRPIIKFRAFCAEQTEQRMRVHAKDIPDKDIMATLLENYHATPDHPLKLDLLRQDARLIIIAGSETTASTLTQLFFHLTANTAIQSRIRAEISGLLNGGEIASAVIKDAKLLNGAINEALRLHPPVPSGVFRTTPPEGIQVGEVFIPGGTTVQTPGYVIGRDELVYECAGQFEKEAFAPFTLGSDTCIGRNLALMEMRLVTAHILTRFEVSLAPGEDGSRLRDQSRDHFTVTLAPLDLVFTPLV